MTRIGIIIVNYRTANLVVDCLASLAADEKLSKIARVVVVDNCSNDGSVEALTRAIAGQPFASWVEVVASDVNRGFGAGNNAGIRKLLHGKQVDTPEYIMCLNPDTWVPVGAIQTLVGVLDSHQEVGVVGSQLCDSAGVLQCSAHAFPSVPGELEETACWAPVSRLLARWRVSPPIMSAAECDWVSGAALMIRTQLLRQIGLFDERFFLYFDEVDLCYRAKRSGWKVRLVSESVITHLEGSSTGSRGTLHKNPHWLASRRIYFQKHHGYAGLLQADAARAAGRMLACLLQPLRSWRGASTSARNRQLVIDNPTLPATYGDRA